MNNYEISDYFFRISRFAIISIVVGCWVVFGSLTYFTLVQSQEAFAQEAEKKAIVFYKNDCLECDEILHIVLPQLIKSHHPNLSILAINNSYPDGGLNYLDAMLLYNFSAAQKLPLLLINSEILSGADEIKEKLPVLINSKERSPQKWEQLESIPSLFNTDLSSAEMEFAYMIEPNQGIGAEAIIKRFQRNYYKDEAGNRLAVIVLAIMIVSVIGIVYYLIKKTKSEIPKSTPIIYPILLIAASGIALYLFFSGLTDSELTCGPVGDCNTVQQSKYAVLFGFIPVSLLGVLSYCAGITFWYLSKRLKGHFSRYMTLGTWGVAIGGMIFFIYLTFLEPFIIGASCAWCLSAATLTTISALVSTPAAKSAYVWLKSNSSL